MRDLLENILQNSNSEIIIEICNSAEKESKLSKSVRALHLKWHAHHLQVEKLPPKTYPFAFVDPIDFLSVKKPGAKTARFALSLSSHMATDQECIQLVTNAENLCVELEEDITSLQVYLSSVSSTSHISTSIKSWLVMLRQIMEITTLMTNGQKEVFLHIILCNNHVTTL